MSLQRDLLHRLISEHATEAFKSLLSEKHLYQSIEIQRGYYDDLIAKSGKRAAIKATEPSLGPGRAADPTRAEEEAVANYQAAVAKTFSLPWVARTPVTVGIDQIPQSDEAILFNMPDIHIYCRVCKTRSPFNPHPNVSWGPLPAMQNPWIQQPIEPATAWQLHPFLQAALSRLAGPECRQLFVIAYQCQGCKSEPLVFFVRRKGLKLTLCGRSHIEALPTPQFLPVEVRKYYSDAHIAHQAGQTLAGLFLLRVSVEQFWRNLLQRKVITVATTAPRISGEALGAAYNETLPSDFKSYFPSLPSVYDKLSECIHGADADTAVFDSAASDIVTHFDARRIRKLDAEDRRRIAAMHEE